MAIKVSSFNDWEIENIKSEIYQPNIKIIIYFFSPSFEKYNPQKIISSSFPKALCVGSSMHGGWSSKGAVKTGITVMSISSDEVSDVFFTFQEGVKKEPLTAAKNAIHELKQMTVKEKINPDEYLGLIFFDGLCLGELIIKEFSMEQSLNMAFVGGAAADNMTFTKTLVSAGGKISSDGLVAVILKMKIPFFYNHYVHYLPTEKSFTITRVETMQRIAWEIDNGPAAKIYAREVGVSDIKCLTMEIFARNPLGLIFGDSIYIRSPNSVVDGGGLQFYCYIEAGTRVFLLKRGDIIANAHNSIAKAEQFLPGIQGCLLFNCIQRHLELIELDKIDAFNNVFSEYPMIGFNTYGEELFTHHNQTLTAVFFGTPPEQGMTDPFKTKRLFHYTDNKLKSLVFDIVSRSELLNLTISYLSGNIDSESSYMLAGEEALTNYETIRRNLGDMIDQSNVSKYDIEKMLVVYQNNVEKTGEFVFKIVDEIRAQNRRLVELREEAEIANRTKSSFLASMSHEIRTPMNAITGMAELLSRSDLPAEARRYAQDIKHAGNNLISIINDLLDFSKIEAGRMEIIPEKYRLSSLVNDTIKIIHIKLKDKPIRFSTNIDSKIPNNLIGDEARIRQILINLLSNAVKFTEKGFISLSITAEEQKDNKIYLKLAVADSGKGITEEDQKKLFNEFVQVDLRRNRSVEGTGLGLAITKRLCAIMAGNISLESEYGRGSVFIVTIPQEIDTTEPFTCADNSNILDDETIIRNFTESAENVSGVIRYTFPEAQILVVDDILTNIRVAEGLLSPYKVKFHSCLSGVEAIELCNINDYDIVFMDHMMPAMDGIETTAHIREWEREHQKTNRVSIIALTANAVSGMREMFLNKGFDDFLAKPIDVSKLDDVMNRWIPKIKRVQNSGNSETEKNHCRTAGLTLYDIQEINIQTGIKMTGGTEEGYIKVLCIFQKDAKERLLLLDSELEKGNIQSFATNIHALKSASASIGAEQISAEAAGLEAAGKNGNTDFIRGNFPEFKSRLTGLLDKLKTVTCFSASE
ncbi:MAG: ATP-binding protein [Treponema sp.]|nr:ATP-binding protein [Treponema sp.]MCL2272883.1 ATP-binding protein [Treponema sp.]